MFPNIAMDMSGGSTVVVNVPANSDNSGNSSGSGGGGQNHHHQYYHHRGGAAAVVVDGQQQQQQQPPSRYESQKRRDWNTFGQYLRNHRPPLALSRCSGAHVLEFLRYLDQFGKTKVHAHGCPFFGHPHPPAPCPCPLRQAWGSLDALIGRLRAAFEENGGAPEANFFAARAVRLYLRDVRDTQAKARGIAYDKKKRKRPPPPPPQPPPPPPLPTAILHDGFGPIMAAPTAGVANLQVTDLNSTDGFVMMHHPQYHLYHLYHHHGDHESTSSGSGSTGGGGVVMAAPDSHSGSLIPLSVLN